MKKGGGERAAAAPRLRDFGSSERREGKARRARGGKEGARGGEKLCTHTRARVRDSVHACACACGQCARARACSCECKRVRVRACIQALTHSRCLAVSPLPSQPSFRPSLPLSLPAPPSLVSFPLPRPPSLPFFSPFSLSFPHPTPLATIAAAR